jgi:histone-lysine N-methyltransferase SETD3
MITLELAKSLPFCRKLECENLKLLSPKHTYLSIYLLNEKKCPKSFWKPYIDILPCEYTTYPILYTKEEL